MTTEALARAVERPRRAYSPGVLGVMAFVGPALARAALDKPAALLHATHGVRIWIRVTVSHGSNGSAPEGTLLVSLEQRIVLTARLVLGAQRPAVNLLAAIRADGHLRLLVSEVLVLNAAMLTTRRHNSAPSPRSADLICTSSAFTAAKKTRMPGAGIHCCLHPTHRK